MHRMRGTIKLYCPRFKHWLPLLSPYADAMSTTNEIWLLSLIKSYVPLYMYKLMQEAWLCLSYDAFERLEAMRFSYHCMLKVKLWIFGSESTRGLNNPLLTIWRVYISTLFWEWSDWSGDGEGTWVVHLCGCRTVPVSFEIKIFKYYFLHNKVFS